MNYKLILEKAFDSNDKPNLILYGYHKIDKYEILKEYLKLDKYPLTEMNKYDIKYHSNNTIKLFDMDTIKKSKIESFFNLVFEIVKCKNYYITDNRLLILNNFNNINKTIQDRFRVIFEKYRKTTVFILITDNYNSIFKPVSSRFLSIRIRDLVNQEKISISYPIIKNLTYDKRIKIYDKIYDNSDKNIIINYSKNNYGLINDYKDIIKHIYESIKNMKTLNLKKIKDYAYILEKYHIKYFHRYFLKLVLENINNDLYKKSVFTIMEIEARYIKSFNRILSNEFLLIFIYNLLNNLS